MLAKEFLKENAELERTQNELLQNKYAGLLEGVDDSWPRKSMAKIYQNEMNYLDNFKRQALSESTLSGNIPDLVKFVFPVIRKVWANLFANGLFSIQPMNSPIGGIFYYDYKYGTTKGTITAGQNMIENFDHNYASEYVAGESIADGPGAGPFAGTIIWKPIKPQSMGQVGIAFKGTAVSDGTIKTIYDGDGSGTLTGDGTGSIDFTTGAYTALTFGESVTDVIANYFFVMEANAANVPEIRADIQLTPVIAQSRKIKMLWSSEAADDMRAVLGMDVEPELTAGVASEIKLGIDRTLIMAAFGSGTTIKETFNAAVPPGRNDADHYKNITTALSKVSGEINKRTKRGPANFIVIPTDVEPIIDSFWGHGDLRGAFNDLPQPPQGQGTGGRPAFPTPRAPTGYGIYSMGMLQKKWLVIVDPFFPAGQILVGLKGTLFTDSGLVYAPYVPLEMTTAFLDPSDWVLRKGIRTRDMYKVVNPNFFGIVEVTNLP